MDVYFDTTDLVLVVANGQGRFSAEMKVPASALPGVHWVTAVGRTSSKVAQKPFM